jgi:hypothetical protein
MTGEKDFLRGIEDVDGTDQDDVLTGTDADENDLLGNKGHDTIAGLGRDDRVWGEGGGEDSLTGGNGDDIVIAEGGGNADGGPGSDQMSGSGTLLGDAGDDTIEAGPGSVVCGAGSDTVTLSQASGPTIDPSCEFLGVGGEGALGMSLPITRQADGLQTTIFCDEEDGPIDICHGTMSVSLGEQVVASGSYSVSEDSKPLNLPYTNGGKEALGDSPKQVIVNVGGFTFGLTI